jgi:hypothetical protein
MCVFVQCLADVNIGLLINGVLERYGKGQEAPTTTFYHDKGYNQ